MELTFIKKVIELFFSKFKTTPPSTIDYKEKFDQSELVVHQLSIDNAGLQESIKKLTTENTTLSDTVTTLQLENESLINEVQSHAQQKQAVSNSEYWNTKWKQEKVYYAAPDRKLVTEYVKYRRIPSVSLIADTLILSNNLSADMVDSIPLAAMTWLNDKFDEGNFTYKLDDGEQWEDPETTLSTLVNDCDGWGLVEYFVIREMFMKLNVWESVRHRLKCVAGNINKYGSFPYQNGAHFYLLWLHSDGEWYTVETTYVRGEALARYGHKPLKINPAYGAIWFTFNDQYSWAQNSITVTRSDLLSYRK